MNEFPTITVALTTYKRPALLKRAVQSVLDQTYPHFKICIYDDASGDETGEMVTKMCKSDSRIFYYCNDQNLGNMKNYALSVAQIDTPYFIHLADDDLLLPNHFESALEGFRKYPEALLSVNQAISVNENRQIHKVTLSGNCREGLYEPPEGLIFLIKTDPSIVQAAVYRSELKELVGFYDSELGQVSDWDYIFRIAVQFPFVVNKKPGTIFYMNTTGYSGSASSQFFWPQWLKMYQGIVEHPSLNLEAKCTVEALLKSRLKSMLVAQGKESILCGKYTDAGMSAKVLKDFFNSPRHYFKLKITAMLCKLFPPYSCYLKFLKNLRSRRKLLKTKSQYPEYQKYTSYL
jgi:glycosyltransferase involved in cell wall biosynthesis